MVYITEWDKFIERSIELFRADPEFKYQEYMQQGHKKKLPGVGFKKLKKILKKCRRRDYCDHSHKGHTEVEFLDIKTIPDHCPDSLFQARATVQVPSAKYAQGNSSKSLALQAYGI